MTIFSQINFLGQKNWMPTSSSTYLIWNSLEKKNNLDLVSVGGVHVEPMAVYSKKIKNINDLKAGDTILIPNDPTNAGRALILLDKAGVIKLKDNKNLQATVNDITENPKNIKIAQLAPEQLAPRLEEVAAAVINANFALDAKLSLKTIQF